MGLTQPSGAKAGEAIREQLSALCMYYLTTDDFGRDLMMSTGRQQAEGHPIQLTRQLHLVPRTGLDPQTKLINEIIERLPLALVR